MHMDKNAASTDELTSIAVATVAENRDASGQTATSDVLPMSVLGSSTRQNSA
jgi:hypothetical protein